MKQFITLCFLIVTLNSCQKDGSTIVVKCLPPIFPDYTEVTVPSNIAPLNFMLMEKCDRIEVIIEGKIDKIDIRSRLYADIPLRKWRKILRENDELNITVKAKREGKWTEYAPFKIYISKDEIDYGLCYRRIDPGYETYSKMGIYQRDLSCFKESTIIENTLLPGNCINCHSFAKCDPQIMQLHIRGKNGGTLVMNGEYSEMLDTKTKATGFSCVYPYWHPSGRYIAYSVNNIKQIFHNVPDQILDVYDLESSVVIYDIQKNKLLVYPALKGKTKFNTFPVFSADGCTLFFCSADAQDVSQHLRDIKYSLCSISFNPETGEVGEEIKVLYDGAGGSVSFPRPSYDGKYLMFTRSAYGNFIVWHKDADLYLLDLKSGETRSLDELNSDNTESYHSWSSSSKWVVFSSRRIDGLYTRPYLAHINSEGKFSKPFILPQRDPGYYDRLLQSYNIPEFIIGKVKLPLKKIEQPSRKKVE